MTLAFIRCACVCTHELCDSRRVFTQLQGEFIPIMAIEFRHQKCVTWHTLSQGVDSKRQPRRNAGKPLTQNDVNPPICEIYLLMRVQIPYKVKPQRKSKRPKLRWCDANFNTPCLIHFGQLLHCFLHAFRDTDWG